MQKFLFRKSDKDIQPFSNYERFDREGLIGHHTLSWLNDDKYVVVQILPSNLPDRNEFEKQGGSHLGVVRSWMQWNCLNGDRVTWGSEDLLKFKGIAVRDLEMLAIDIAYNILKEKELVK